MPPPIPYKTRPIEPPSRLSKSPMEASASCEAGKSGLRVSVLVLALLLGACSQQFAVSVNNQAVFDPGGRLVGGEAIDADLQGCINFAMLQQDVEDPGELSVLSCANSNIQNLESIGILSQLRFLDLGNNSVSNITPLEDLPQLSGLNLANNPILDIGPLLIIPTLTSVSLLGNNNIPCRQIAQLVAKLGDNLTPPEGCRN